MSRSDTLNNKRLNELGYEAIDTLHRLAYPDCPILNGHCHAKVFDEVVRA